MEDLDDTRWVVASLLESDGFEVVTAATVAEAIDRLRERSVDAIVTDFNLPDGNGMKLINEARKSGLLRREPAIVYSALPHVSVPPDVTLLQKPFDPEAFLGVVRRATKGGVAA